MKYRTIDPSGMKTYSSLKILTVSILARAAQLIEVLTDDGELMASVEPFKKTAIYRDVTPLESTYIKVCEEFIEGFDRFRYKINSDGPYMSTREVLAYIKLHHPINVSIYLGSGKVSDVSALGATRSAICRMGDAGILLELTETEGIICEALECVPVVFHSNGTVESLTSDVLSSSMRENNRVYIKKGTRLFYSEPFGLTFRVVEIGINDRSCTVYTFDDAIEAIKSWVHKLQPQHYSY